MNYCARCGWEIVGKPARADGTDWHPGCVPSWAPLDPLPPVTARQQEAIEWLERVGKATAKLARKHGFAQRTLDALADAGRIQRDYMPSTFRGSFPVYRPLSREAVDADGYGVKSGMRVR
jgi:hypothetical protein